MFNMGGSKYKCINMYVRICGAAQIDAMGGIFYSTHALHTGFAKYHSRIRYAELTKNMRMFIGGCGLGVGFCSLWSLACSRITGLLHIITSVWWCSW